MWSSLRRQAAHHPLRNQGRRFAAATIHYAKIDVLSSVAEVNNGIINCSEELNERANVSQRWCHYRTPSFSGIHFGGSRYLSSQTGVNQSDNENDESESEIAELDSVAADGVNTKEEDKDELESNEIESNEIGNSVKDLEWRAVHERLLRRLLDCHGSITNVLDKWIEEGNKFDQDGISMITYHLRKRTYLKALQFSEWLEATKQLDLTENDFALRLDMIARSQGLHRAEKFIENIPESFKGELIYRTFIARCVFALNVKKAEEVLNKMKTLKLPLTVQTCNQMIILYKRLDNRKIANVLLSMQKENVEPSLVTFKLLMDSKGESNDIVGMEELYEKMLAKGFKPDVGALFILVKHYASAGFKDKAETILKEVDKDELKKNFGARSAMLRLNGSLGNEDEVSRIWEECKLDPTMDEIVAAIEAWGVLGKVDKAEAVFETAPQRWNKLSSRHYTALLRVYAKHKLETEGKELMKRMADNGCKVGPLAWDALVRLYVKSGNLKKAELVLNNASQQKQRPLFNSFMIVMELYAERGDVHNTEKWLSKMRDCGYSGRIKPFQALVQAYVNAKVPAYGIRDRMKAENLVPNRALSEKLALVDTFWKTKVSHLVD